MRHAHHRGIVVLVAALALGGMPASVEAGNEKKASYGPAYEVHGGIVAPTSVGGSVRCPGPAGNGAAAYEIVGVTPGRVFSLRADDATYRNDFDIRFYASAADCAAGVSPLPHRNHAGDEHAVVPAGAAVAVVTLAVGGTASFTYTELPSAPLRPRRGRKAVTVVAVVESRARFGVYHQDFLGSHHPWNTDADRSNDIDFSQPPSTYIPAMPAVTTVPLTLPTSGDQSQAALRAADQQAIDAIRTSSEDAPNLYWFPGTKVVAAATFGAPPSELIWGTNDTHATKVASVAAGNIHGTCPECVFVLLSGGMSAVKWAAKQPWIDVVTNSWIAVQTAPLDVGPSYGTAAKDAVEDGQTIVWGAGNGTVGTMADGPSLTWWSGQRGPDWIVTVGAVVPGTEQVPSGAGRPVDVVSYGDDYPSAGGTTVSGETTFAGTSNAAPVVAGTFAKVVQLGRLALGDETPGRGGGVVAEGRPVDCVLASAPCPLGDGVLTRAEVQQLVFDNVLPSVHDATPSFAESPSTQLPGALDLLATVGSLPPEFTPVTQGHGIVHGRYDPARFVAEQRRFADALVGAVVRYTRPAGERAWMTADSHCRQQMWGTWTGGYYTGRAPTVVDPLDGVGAAVDAGCAQLPSQMWERFVVVNG